MRLVRNCRGQPTQNTLWSALASDRLPLPSMLQRLEISASSTACCIQADCYPRPTRVTESGVRRVVNKAHQNAAKPMAVTEFAVKVRHKAKPHLRHASCARNG